MTFINHKIGKSQMAGTRSFTVCLQDLEQGNICWADEFSSDLSYFALSTPKTYLGPLIVRG